MKRILLLIVLLIGFCTQNLWAQDRTISGTVSAESDGTGLPGASVRVKGTSQGTITDLDGKFTLKISADAKALEISFVGMTKEEVAITSESVYNVALKAETRGLEEVVVTAFGAKQEKRSLGYSVQDVKGDDISKAQRGNFVNSLQGRIAGASVTATSGQPGASASIMLRGVSSLGRSNQPLFIVDGVPVDNTTFSTAYSTSANISGADFANRRFDFTNRIADLNPDDFESITVLKGPEAAALYGIDAASGAIVITTKKGKAGKSKLSYSNTFSIAQVYKYPDISKKYNRGYSSVTDTTARSFFGSPYPEGTSFYDNMKDFYRLGKTQTHNVSVEGGGDNTTFRLSGAFTSEEGVEPGSTNTKLNVGASGTAKISPKLSVEGSLNYIFQDLDKVTKGSDGAFINLLMWPANDDARNYLTETGDRRLISGKTYGDDGKMNPYFVVDKTILNDKTNRVNGNVYATFKPLSWLTLTGRGGWDFYSTEMNIKYHPQASIAYTDGGNFERNVFNVALVNTNYFARINKIFGDFKLNLDLGSDVIQRTEMNTSVRGTKLLLPEFNTLNNVNSTSLKSTTTYKRTRMVSVLGNFSVAYKDMLTLTATHRNDWTSTLVKDRRSFGYSSLNTSFVYTDILKNDILSFGKIRAAWGQAGKVPGAYEDQAALEIKSTTGGGYSYGYTAPNKLLIPEFTTSYEIGSEMKFFNNKLGFDFSYWKKRVEDQYIPGLRKSYGGGFVLYNMNGGTFESNGIEATATYNFTLKNDINWTIGLNFARSNSEIIKLPGTLTTFYNSDTWAYGNVVAGAVIGGTATSFLGYDYYRNNNGQILIDPASGLPLKNATWVQVGDRNPDFTLGITNDFKWRNLSVSFLIDIRKGGDVYNGNEQFYWSSGLSPRQDIRNVTHVYPGVLKDGLENSANPTVNTIGVTPGINSSYYTSVAESDYIDRDVSWVKLSDITINLSASKEILSKLKIFSAASIFFTATDLFYISNYSGIDPNVNINTAATVGSGGAGFDYGSIPTPRTFKFGLKVTL
jgi:TonB-linked SusC/RagA family outer membrane protein